MSLPGAGRIAVQAIDDIRKQAHRTESRTFSGAAVPTEPNIIYRLHNEVTEEVTNTYFTYSLAVTLIQDWKTLFRNDWFLPPGSARDLADERIKTHFREYFQNMGKFVPKNKWRPESWSTSAVELLASIILFDQIARHVYRKEPHMQKLYGEMALDRTNLLFRHYVHFMKNIVEMEDILFATMPFRHFPSTSRLECVRKEYLRAQTILQQKKGDVEAQQRLHAAANRALQANVSTYARGHKFSSAGMSVESISYDDILENHACDVADYQQYLKSSTPFSELKKTIEGWGTEGIVVVSLSGGVDSMLLLHMVKLFTELHPQYEMEIAHVNYNVREESTKEEEFLTQFITQKRWGKLHVETIEKYMGKAIWEKETRRRRYELYKRIGFSRVFCVCTGHNLDDKHENVFCNLFGGSGSANSGNTVLKLGGMRNSQVNDGISFLRPFVDTSKKEIVKLAKKCGIPFMADTSLQMHRRTRVRRELIPLVREIMGPRTEERLVTMEKTSEMAEDLVEMLVNQYMKTNVKQGIASYVICCNGVHDIPLNELLFRVIISRLVQHMPSNKSIRWLLSYGPELHQKCKKKIHSAVCTRFIFRDTYKTYLCACEYGWMFWILPLSVSGTFSNIETTIGNTIWARTFTFHKSRRGHLVVTSN